MQNGILGSRRRTLDGGVIFYPIYSYGKNSLFNKDCTKTAHRIKNMCTSTPFPNIPELERCCYFKNYGGMEDRTFLKSVNRVENILAQRERGERSTTARMGWEKF